MKLPEEPTSHELTEADIVTRQQPAPLSLVASTGITFSGLESSAATPVATGVTRVRRAAKRPVPPEPTASAT